MSDGALVFDGSLLDLWEVQAIFLEGGDHNLFISIVLVSSTAWLIIETVEKRGKEISLARTRPFVFQYGNGKAQCDESDFF